MTHLYYAFVTNEACNDFDRALPTKYVGCVIDSPRQTKTKVQKSRKLKDAIDFNHPLFLSILYSDLCMFVDEDETKSGERIYIFRDLKGIDLTAVNLKMSYNNAFAFGGKLDERGEHFIVSANTHSHMCDMLGGMIAYLGDLQSIVAMGPDTLKHKKFIADLSIHESIFDNNSKIALYHKEYFDQHFRNPLKKLK